MIKLEHASICMPTAGILLQLKCGMPQKCHIQLFACETTIEMNINGGQASNETSKLLSVV